MVAFEGFPPVPPPELIHRVIPGFPGDHGELAQRSFHEHAEIALRAVERALAGVGRSVGDFERLLDFGCGPGRLLRWLARHAGEVELHGTDIDADAIAWLQAHHPQIPTTVNKFRPPLPYPEGSFDLLYSISVITHLEEDAQLDWLAEVRRALAPGGIAFLTVHGERAYRDFTTGDRVGAIGAGRISAHSLSDEGFFYEAAAPSRWNALQFMDDSESWGLAFHSPEYIHERWSPLFRSVEIVPGDGAQDVVLVQV
jgi:SAM-dependent methyltransferase